MPALLPYTVTCLWAFLLMILGRWFVRKIVETGHMGRSRRKRQAC